jgi:hypothetical protein
MEFDFSNSKINDNDLKFMYLKKQLLECSINLSFCKNISNDGLYFLKDAKCINLCGCSQITDI